LYRYGIKALRAAEVMTNKDARRAIFQCGRDAKKKKRSGLVVRGILLRHMECIIRLVYRV